MDQLNFAQGFGRLAIFVGIITFGAMLFLVGDIIAGPIAGVVFGLCAYGLTRLLGWAVIGFYRH